MCPGKDPAQPSLLLLYGVDEVDVVNVLQQSVSKLHANKHAPKMQDHSNKHSFHKMHFYLVIPDQASNVGDGG